ncbi:MAG: ribosome silencing factor [Proteobacteria bacterium]|nr:ribosome silencing factor [Pseudomonadota bacterium]
MPKVGNPKRNTSVKKLLTSVIDSLEDDKAIEIHTIDLKNKSSIADFMVVASGRSSRQVAAIAAHLVQRLKQENLAVAQIEGLPQADWVLIDAGDVIVHVFRPEVRDYYSLEKMWSVDLNSGESLEQDQ